MPLSGRIPAWAVAEAEELMRRARAAEAAIHASAAAQQTQSHERKQPEQKLPVWAQAEADEQAQSHRKRTFEETRQPPEQPEAPLAHAPTAEEAEEEVADARTKPEQPGRTPTAFDALMAKPVQPSAPPRPASSHPAWADWDSGQAALDAALRSGRWPDGARVGKAHVRPYLQPEYARKIASGSKTVEGRPANGWAAAVERDDYVRFNISKAGGARLACRVLRVRRFDTFAQMLDDCGLQACLPGVASVEAGVRLYRSFASTAGSYADLEREHGVVGLDVVPVRVVA